MAQEAHLITDNRRHVDRFYALLWKLRDGLGGGRTLCDCSGKMTWPRRGVYYFFEPGEFRHEQREQLRVVRIGTHAVGKGSRTTLWNRLRAHRGSTDGRGNHRGSVFRQHVGNALLARSQDATSMPSWGLRRSAPRGVRDQETTLERKVSEYIGKMPFLSLAVDDEPGTTSVRAYLERNSIGLLTSETPLIDPPSAEWLGNHSVEPLIRRSGLWNLNHVGALYDPAFLDVLDDYVTRTLAEHSPGQDKASTTHPHQLQVFIGGFMGPSYGIRWENGACFYDRFGDGYVLAETVQLHPADQDWAEFWTRVERLGVWSWKQKYVQRDVCDGTNWSLELKRGSAFLSAAGSNAYPEGLESFCQAVAALAGGRKFE